jgi:hypothetical protein
MTSDNYSENNPADSVPKEETGNVAEYLLDDEATLNNLINSSIVHALSALDQETPSDAGTNYKPFYYGLFNSISLILENTHTYTQMAAALRYLQCQAEDAFIAQAD